MSERPDLEPRADAGTLRGLLWYWGPLLFWLAAILYFSGNAMSSGQTSRFVEPLIRAIVPEASERTVYVVHVAVRKCGHLVEYALVALLAYRALRADRTPVWRARWAVVAWSIAAVWAVLDELRQSLVPARTGTIDDVFVDVAGAAIALLLLRSALTRRTAVDERS